ncbi:MAG: LPP20 family lipoprotein [Planctomycetota bacterium]|jgi:hypothetical protein
MILRSNPWNRSRRLRVVATLVVLAAMLPLGCAHDARPAWVDEPGVARPGALYLTAVGAGASRDEAADAAVARIAQQLAVDVDARETARSTYVADDDGTRGTSRQRVRLDRSIDLDTGVFLMGTEVVETWQEPRGGFFALAVLDRTTAASAYDDLLGPLAEQVRAEREAADRAASSWSRFVYLSRALVAAEEHDRLQRIRSVISPWPASSGSRALAPEIAAARTAVGDELVAVVEPAPGTPGAFEPIVRDALLATGIAVRADASAAVRARIRYDTIERPFGQRQDHVVEWRLTVQLVDSASGRAGLGLTLDGDGWGTTASAASATAVHRARDRLRRELPPYLAGLVTPPGSNPAAGRSNRSDAS